jgi:serine/threonine protein kinase
VLVNTYGRAVLCDFGLAMFMDDDDGLATSEGFKGSLRWASPEQVNSENQLISMASDVWAWAMTALEVSICSLGYSNL